MKLNSKLNLCKLCDKIITIAKKQLIKLYLLSFKEGDKMEYATRQFLPEETRRVIQSISLLPREEVLKYLKTGNSIEQEGAVKSPELTGEDLENFLFKKEGGLIMHEPTVLIAALKNPNLSVEAVRKISIEATHPIVQITALDRLDDDDHVKVNLLKSKKYLTQLKNKVVTSIKETWF